MQARGKQRFSSPELPFFAHVVGETEKLSDILRRVALGTRMKLLRALGYVTDEDLGESRTVTRQP